MNCNTLLTLLISLSIGIIADPIPTITIEVDKENDTPIIGILSVDMQKSLESLYPGLYQSYIAASYVKFIEGSGGRVVPIWIGRDRPYYEDIMSKINGVLFPGGNVWFNETNGYADAGRHVYTIAKEMNDAGNFFPLWGTCLGFELLTFLSANSEEHRASCRSQKQALPLEFKKEYKTSRLYSMANDEVISILKDEAVTANFHSFCVTEKNLTDFKINEWKVLSVNKDFDGFEFVSSIEAINYPFYGVQFHPEKNLYEWALDRNISHTRNAIVANSYFGQFFVNEARKNLQSFLNIDEEQKYLIYNYSPTYTAINGSSFQQCYFFEK